MSAIPNNKPSILAKARAIVARTFTELSEQNLRVVVRELQTCCSDLIRAVTELQDKQAQARFIDVDGFPRHLQRAELFDGQFLRLTQTAGAGQIVTVEHGLRRRPQGALFIKTGIPNNQVLVEGDNGTNTPPADEFRVSFRLNGISGNLHICILF